MSDLEVGMVLEGVVSNVANFGAFVDMRKRIALSMRLNDEPGQDNRSQRSAAPRSGQERRAPRRDEPQGNALGGAMGGAFAAAFAKAKK
ncbi:transcription accessory protein (S1 RNA-binding domain) [Vibrio cholerae]|nr:transcription accessory protein (S1 RNA-binding domain) [Vibrio cholerae]